jgi:uncharacterized protein (DUF1499 family)
MTVSPGVAATPSTVHAGRPLAARLGFALGLAAALLLLCSGPGFRFGLWSFRTGFLLMRIAAYAGIAAMLVSLGGLALARRRGAQGVALAGLVLGAVAFAVPYVGLRQARRVPPIHDITTDTERPPAFVAVLPLRAAAGAANSTTYEGAEVARQQRAAYPDVVPYVAPIPPREALRHALDAARELGWTIVAVDTTAGRIEASTRTRWFGFTDDVVVRVTPTPTGSRVDARSVSRVGKSDVGTNATRLRRFLGRLRSDGFQALR